MRNLMAAVTGRRRATAEARAAEAGRLAAEDARRAEGLRANAEEVRWRD